VLMNHHFFIDVVGNPPMVMLQMMNMVQAQIIDEQDKIRMSGWFLRCLGPPRRRQSIVASSRCRRSCICGKGGKISVRSPAWMYIVNNWKEVYRAGRHLTYLDLDKLLAEMILDSRYK
jgi:hypothetical protein